MGKPFTDKEREEIKEKLRRAGLKVLAETGINSDDISVEKSGKHSIGVSLITFFT